MTSKAAACNKDGEKERHCKNCTYVEVEKVPASTVPHKYDEGEVTTPATCTKEGVKTFTCSVCGNTKTEAVDVDSTAHTPGEAKKENEVAATCSQEGSYDLVVRCTECDSVISSEHKTTEKLSHVYGEWEVTKAATCLEKGEEKRTCENCDAFETKAIDPNPNNHVNGSELRNAKTATCKEKGYTGDLCCVDCKTPLEKGKEIPIDRFNHTGETETRNAKEATCTKDGYSGDIYCLGCGVRLERGQTISAFGHEDEDKDGRCDTCGAEYYTHETCPCRCHKSGFDKFLFKLALFFQMLFDKNQICKCGDIHY